MRSVVEGIYSTQFSCTLMPCCCRSDEHVLANVLWTHRLMPSAKTMSPSTAKENTDEVVEALEPLMRGCGSPSHCRGVVVYTKQKPRWCQCRTLHSALTVEWRLRLYLLEDENDERFLN